MTTGPSANGDLGAIVTGLVRRSVLLAAVSAIVVALYALTLPNAYQAASTLVLAPSPLKSSAEQAQSFDPERGNPAARVSFLMAGPLGVRDYEVLLTNPEIVERLRERYVELRKAAGKDVDEIKLEDVRDAMQVKTRVLKQTINDVVYQPFLELAFQTDDPAIAAAVANVWADLGIERATEISRKGQEGMLDFLKQQLDDKAGEVGKVEEELAAITSELVIPTALERLGLLEKEVATLQIELAKLVADIAHGEAELAQLNEQIKGIPEKVALRRAPPDEAYWLLQGQGKSVDGSKVLLSEEINGVYSEVRKTLVQTDAKLRGMQAEKTAREQSIADLQQTIAGLRRDIAENTRKHDEAERRKKGLDGEYLQLAASYGAARIAVSTKTPDLKLAAKAVAPEKKTGPHRSIMVLAGALLGACIAPAFVLFKRAAKQLSDIVASVETVSARSAVDHVRHD